MILLKAIHQTAAVAEELVDDDVVWHDPADPVEEGEGLEDVAGDEVPAGGAGEGDEEELLAAHAPAAAHAGVDLLVERVEEGARHQVRGPDCARAGGDVW